MATASAIGPRNSMAHTVASDGEMEACVHQGQHDAQPDHFSWRSRIGSASKPRQTANTTAAGAILSHATPAVRRAGTQDGEGRPEVVNTALTRKKTCGGTRLAATATGDSA